MTTITGDTSFTLDGTSDFVAGPQTYSWSDGWIESIDLWSGHVGNPYAVTVTLSGSNWNIGSIRIDGNTTAIINDTTAVGSEVNIDYMWLGGPLGPTVTLTNANVTTIKTGDASVNVTTGAGWLGSFLSFGGDDVLTIGSGGADSIRVGHGDNTVTTTTGWVGSIIAYSGNDTVTIGAGGAGSLYVSHGDNTVTTTTEWVGSIVAYSGNDTVAIGGGGAGSIYLGGGGNHVETGAGTVGAITVVDGNDTISIGSGGVRSLFTGAGDDLVTIAAQTVADQLLQINADLGVDRIDFSTLTANLIVSLAAFTANSSQVTAILSGFENVTGGAGNDMLTGDGSINVIDGGGGNDTVNGGTGADTMRGGAGNDTYYVDNAGDIVDESVAGSSGFDRVHSTVSFSLSDASHFMGGIEMGVLLGSANLYLAGNGLNNLLIGNAGANAINGVGGADIMRGMAGNDTYYVDNAGDVVDETGGSGFDRVHSTVSFSLSDAAHFMGGIEMGVLLGSANLNLAGNGLNNLLIGNAGANVINGAGGADTMRGMAGNDTYYVDNAGDVVDETGGSGFDRVHSTISLDMSDTAHFMGAIEMGVLLGGNNLNLTGNGLNNLLFGNAGSNVINGGVGNDMLTGNAGADTFAFTTALNGATNVDNITDFNVADDTIRLENAIFTGLAAGVLAANAFTIGSAAADASDRIVYNSATGALSFDADGVGGTAAIQFAHVATGLALTNADFIVV